MEEKQAKDKEGFGRLFEEMVGNEHVTEKALGYLHKEKKVPKSVIYDDLVPKKLMGYSPERNALAFPLMRGFIVVGIRYLCTESVKIDDRIIKKDDEYNHEGSDVETGLFRLQENYRDTLITSRILDLLSAGIDGVSLPFFKGFKHLQLFSDMNIKLCFRNTKEEKLAAKKIQESLPQSKIIKLPDNYTDLNQLLIKEGPEAIRSLLTTEKKGPKDKRPEATKREGLYLQKCTYFPWPGPNNTEATLRAAFERSRVLGIRKILIPSTTGVTALNALGIFEKNFSIIVVTHVTGFHAPDHQELSENNRELLAEKGATVLTAQHAFGGVGRAFRNKTGTYQIDELMAYTLRVFGQGTKVAVEIALMASDAGLVSTDEDVVSLGGTGNGVDTALLIRPVPTHKFFDLKIREIICKPRDF